MPKTRILIVDDHPLVSDWLTRLLEEQSDMEVCGQAADIHTALASMRKSAPDIAVVDLTLNRESGLDLIKVIGEKHPQTQVVVLSMHEEIGYAERALRAGAKAYVTKRESSGKIVEAIRETVSGRIYASPSLLAELTQRLIGTKAKGDGNPVDLLSDRELEVFARLGRGLGTREIATDLGVSLPTVQTYCMRIKEKLALSNGATLTREAVRWVEEQNRNQ